VDINIQEQIDKLKVESFDKAKILGGKQTQINQLQREQQEIMNVINELEIKIKTLSDLKEQQSVEDEAPPG